METYKGFDQFNCFPKSNWIMGQKNVKVIFIGNSITFHGPAPEIGWMHSHGIASSQKNNDYVHVFDLPPPCRTKVMEQSPLISENSGYETIQIYR